MKTTAAQPKFDFEIGYLVESPCRQCSQRDQLPGCTHCCNLLDGIQTLLAKGISSSRTLAAADTYSLKIQQPE